MIYELIIIGIFIGFLSGLFGIGGGIILIPLLIQIGINIKDAINISIIQMIFSSIFGSYLNYLNKKILFKDIIYIGIGGFIGGYFGHIILNYISEIIIYIIYIIILLYSITKLFLHNVNNLQTDTDIKINTPTDIKIIGGSILLLLYIFIGIPIGLFSNILGITLFLGVL